MINEKLHSLFHDLIAPIGSIDTLSQICASYITKFDLERLEGKFKKEITSTFKNSCSYHYVIIEKLKLVVDALIEIGEKDIALALQNDVISEVEKIKALEAATKLLYSRLLSSDTKENLLGFAEKVSNFKLVCNSLSKIISDCKDHLTALGKY